MSIYVYKCAPHVKHWSWRLSDHNDVDIFCLTRDMRAHTHTMVHACVYNTIVHIGVTWILTIVSAHSQWTWTMSTSIYVYINIYIYIRADIFILALQCICIVICVGMLHLTTVLHAYHHIQDPSLATTLARLARGLEVTCTQVWWCYSTLNHVDVLWRNEASTKLRTGPDDTQHKPAVWNLSSVSIAM